MDINQTIQITLLLLLIFQQIAFVRERRDYLNRLMAKNLTEYATAKATIDPEPKMKIPDKSKSELVRI